MDDDFRKNALAYHRLPRPGKLSVEATKRMANQRDLALAYSPGVAAPCEAIAADPSLARATPDGSSLLLWLPRDDEARAIAIARLLLRHGADSSVRDSIGKTPADRAERLAMFELADLLKRAR